MPASRTIAKLFRRFPACVSLLLLAACTLGSVASARAEEWMFRRSYYSHAPVEGWQMAGPRFPHRSAYRPAIVSDSPGFSARGAYRYNTVFLQSGNSVDVTVIREGFFELRP